MSGIGAVYTTTASVPDWHQQAACGGMAHVMDPHPASEAVIDYGRQICWGCPVFRLCRSWMAGLTADTDPGGMLAAVTYAERTGHSRDRKLCRGCLAAKPRDAFYGRGANQRSRCKACDALRRPSERAEEAA